MVQERLFQRIPALRRFPEQPSAALLEWRIFTPDGRMVDTMPLRCEIFEMMREYVGANLAKKITNVVDVLKLAAQVEDGHEGLHLLMVDPHIPVGAKLYEAAGSVPGASGT